jgi:hypothetical protein
MYFEKTYLRKSYKYKQKVFVDSFLGGICRDENMCTFSFSGPNSELIIAGSSLEKYETVRT